MKNAIIANAFAVLLAAIAGADEAPEWENLAVNSINRLPARTYSVPLADERSALCDEIEPVTPYRLSLNGIWKFSWTGDPALRVKDFWRSDFDDSDWFSIDVPSCTELKGFGIPIYTNSDYPHEKRYPFIRDSITGEANYNPVVCSRSRPSGKDVAWCSDSRASTPPIMSG